MYLLSHKRDKKKSLFSTKNKLFFIRQAQNSGNDFVKKCINIIYQHFDDLEVLQFYGINEDNERILFSHMPAKDAKVIFKPWEHSREIYSRPFGVLKDVDDEIPFSPFELQKNVKDIFNVKNRIRKVKSIKKN